MNQKDPIIFLKETQKTTLLNCSSSSEEWLAKVLRSHNEGSLPSDGKIEFTGSLNKRSNDEFFLKGDLKASFNLACSRCCDPIPQNINQEVKVLFMFGDEPLGKMDSQILLESDRQFLEQDGVDLSDIINENIEFLLPMAPLCKETCLGLCQECGSDLNVNSCGCKPTVFNGLEINL